GLGLTFGCLCTQFTPFQIQVSPKEWLILSCPPNRRTELSAGLYAITAPPRGGGEFAGCSCVQFWPSHVQVSLKRGVGLIPARRQIASHCTGITPASCLRPLPPWPTVRFR